MATTAGYFGAQRQRVKQLAKALDLRYSGELVFGISSVLVVADCSSSSQAELLTGLKARTAALWGNVAIVSHRWQEDSMLSKALFLTWKTMYWSAPCPSRYMSLIDPESALQSA